MRVFLFPLLALLLSLPALPACKASRSAKATAAATPTAATPTAATPTAAAAAPQQQEPVLSFGRTACFGICPDFTARFYADGRMEYEGRQHAPVEGNRTVKIDPAVVRQMVREAEQIGFFQLRDVYSRGATDVPSTMLSISTAQGTKNVRVDEGGPESLEKLFTRLDYEVKKALGVLVER